MIWIREEWEEDRDESYKERRDGDVGVTPDMAASILRRHGNIVTFTSMQLLVSSSQPLFLPQPSRVHAASMMAKQHAHLMGLVGKMIPPLSTKLHKGQAGECQANPYSSLS
jgi:ATP-dependent NAD(P)H-hydrate dehydratase